MPLNKETRPIINKNDAQKLSLKYEDIVLLLN